MATQDNFCCELCYEWISLLSVLFPPQSLAGPAGSFPGSPAWSIIKVPPQSPWLSVLSYGGSGAWMLVTSDWSIPLRVRTPFLATALQHQLLSDLGTVVQEFSLSSPDVHLDSCPGR